MRKVLLSLAVLAALASCSKNQVVEGPSSKAISFKTLNDRLTKAANNIGGVSDNYKVYAVSEQGTGWLLNEELSGTTDAILSGRSYFYPANSSVSFFAYAPASASGVVDTYFDAEAEAKGLTLAYTVNADAAEDFTTAQKTQDAGQVDLVFAHQLSKVSISSKLEYASMGNYEITQGSATLVVDGNQFVVDLTTGVAEATTVDGTVDTEYSGSNSYMIAPQSAVGCTVALNGVTITSKTDGSVLIGNATFKTMTIVEGNVPDNTFAAGKHYSILLTINADSEDIADSKITFSSKIQAWQDASGGLTQE